MRIGMMRSVVLAVGVLLALAAWQPDLPLDELKARWGATPSQWRTLQIAATNESPAAWIDIHLRDEGPRDDPNPIVLLHGIGASLHTWDAWTHAIKPKRRVIRVDLPGFGLTGPFADGNYSMARYSAVLDSLAAALHLPPAIYAGNSLGARIAWEHALRRKEQVSKLLLLNSAGFPLELGNMPLAFLLAQLPVIKHTVSLSMPHAVVERSVRHVYAQPARVSDALVEQYKQLALREGNRAALVRQFEWRKQDELEENSKRLAGITQPTLIVWGEQDRLIPPSHAQRFVADIQQARLVILPHLGHVPMEEDPARSLAAVQSFLGL